MKKENRTNRRKGFFVGLLVFLLTLGLGLGIKAAWDSLKVEKDININIDDNVVLTATDFKLVDENLKYLIPWGAVKGIEDTYELIYETDVKIESDKTANCLELFAVVNNSNTNLKYVVEFYKGETSLVDNNVAVNDTITIRVKISYNVDHNSYESPDEFNPAPNATGIKFEVIISLIQNL